MYDFINQYNKEWNLSSLASLLPSNVVTNIKAIPIPSSPIRGYGFLGFLRMEDLLLSEQFGQ